MLKETIKNMFDKTPELPHWMVRNPRMDAKLLVENYGRPECLRASNGKSYIYFEYEQGKNFSMMRQMGLRPMLHYTRYSFPARWICRVPLSVRGMSDNARSVIKELKNIAREGNTNLTESKEEYNKYITKYKSVCSEKTK